MKKLLSILFAAFALLGLVTAKADSSQDRLQDAERSAMVEWVADHAQEKLDTVKSALIVDHATYQAQRHAIDPALILAVIRTESGFREKAKSNHGARGLMQVIPYWHRDKLKGRNPLDAKVSIEVGTQVLSDCLKKHNGNRLKALSCYSGGGGKKYYSKVLGHKQSLKNHLQQATYEGFVVRLAAAS